MLYSDEIRICLKSNDHRAEVEEAKLEYKSLDPYQNSKDGLLCFGVWYYDGRRNSKLCGFGVRTCSSIVVDCAVGNSNFMHDSAPPHTNRSTQNSLEREEIRVVEWPKYLWDREDIQPVVMTVEMQSN